MINNEPKPRYIVRTAADALQPQEPVEFVIKDLISRGSVNLFYGEAGVKKTYLLIALGVCVAGGKKWLNFDVIQTKVLYIDEDNGNKRFTSRLGEGLRGEGCGPETPFSYVCYGAFKLDKPTDTTLLQALIEVEEPGLVIIDVLADVMDGDENSKQDTQPVFTNLRKIADQTNAAIILIHHANKAGGYRGSSAIKGAVDTMILVESENGKNTISFKCEKNRDAEPQEWGAIATWFEDKFFLRPSLTDIAPHYSKAESYVLRYLEDHGPSKIPDITGAADMCSAEGARLAVYSLTRKEKTYRTNPEDKGKGSIAIYALRSTNEPE